MNNLIPVEELKDLSVSKQYVPMLELIAEHRLSAFKGIVQVGKSHTQFQSTMLDNAAPLGGLTRMRNRRQALSDIFHTETAIRESILKKEDSVLRIEELHIKAEEKRKEADKVGMNGSAVKLKLKARRLDVKARKLESEIQDGDVYLFGAVRKLSRRYEQFHALEIEIKEKLGKKPDYQITEQDEEEEEIEFHIEMAFGQSLPGARSRGGIIDHGNLIYIQSLGIPGVLAQQDVKKYLEFEQQLIVAGLNRVDDITGFPLQDVEPDPVQLHALECEFLRDMYKKYKKCPAALAKQRGLLPEMSKVTTLGYVEKLNADV